MERIGGSYYTVILHFSFKEIEVQRNDIICSAAIPGPCYLGNPLNTTFLGPVTLYPFFEKGQVAGQLSSVVSSSIQQVCSLRKCQALSLGPKTTRVRGVVSVTARGLLEG